MTEDQPLSLRERKKRDTRWALSDAALELMFERGIENVLREDIAARAGVSVRTFTNYFASKYEAISYRQIERLTRTVHELRARPAAEPLWTAITTAVLAPFQAEGRDFAPPRPDQQAELRKLISSPDNFAAVTRSVRADLIAVIAQRTGAAPDSLYPRLVADTTLATVLAAVDTYAHCDPPVSISVLVRQAFELLAEGLPQPAPPH